MLYGAAVEPELLARLDLKLGDHITIGNIPVELRAKLTGEPDKIIGGIGFGPRVLISEAALRASGLLQPGSLVRWQYRLRLLPAEHEQFRGRRPGENGAGRFPERRLGHSHPHAGIAATRTRCGAIRPIPRRWSH